MNEMPLPSASARSHGRTAACIALFAAFLSASPSAQQPEQSAFGCEPGAVQVLVDGHPRLKFEPLEYRPLFFSGHQFTFKSVPFGLVRIYLTATVSEDGIGPGSTAQLTIYAETATTAEMAVAGKSRWWRLAGRTRPDDSYIDTSHTLQFEPRRLWNCFGFENRPEDECAFADVSLASEDDNLPLIVIGFTQHLGGANAQNWTDARLLLDFRSDPPQVAATLDCGYNEGGGACSALDSSMSPRSALDCAWAADVNDFLCTETTSQGRGSHRDFYLFANRLAPARRSEVASLEAAAEVLARNGKGQSVTVYKLGPVSFIDEIRIDARTSAMLLSGDGTFYLAPHTAGETGRILSIVPHGILDPASAPEVVELPQGRWTGDVASAFTSRTIFRSGDLTVLQVVEIKDAPHLYWVGIQAGDGGLTFDATRLVGDGSYEGCGKVKVPAAVLSVGEIAKPFRVQVRIQPPTVDNMFGEADVEWPGESEGEEIDTCFRNATVSWSSGTFTTQVDRRPCPSPDKPHRVTVDADGRLRLDAGSERKE